MRLQFDYAAMMGRRAGLIVERETPKPNNGHSRYSVHFPKDGSTSLCKNLMETYSEILNYVFENPTHSPATTQGEAGRARREHKW